MYSTQLLCIGFAFFVPSFNIHPVNARGLFRNYTDNEMDSDITWMFVQAILEEFSNSTVVFLSDRTEYLAKVAKVSKKFEVPIVLLNSMITKPPNLMKIELETENNLLYLVLCNNYSLYSSLTKSVGAEINILFIANTQDGDTLKQRFPEEEYYQMFFGDLQRKRNSFLWKMSVLQQRKLNHGQNQCLEYPKGISKSIPFTTCF